METDEGALLAREELARRAELERGRYYQPNGKIAEFLSTIADNPPGAGETKIFILRGGNSGGKTALAANLIGYICDAISNGYFDKVEYLKHFRRPSVGRLYTTANAAKNTYEAEFAKWFSRGQYVSQNDGKTFKHSYKFKRTSSHFDIFTFDQDSEAGESITLDWAVVDEPMARKHWTALKSRFRFGGIIIFVLTPLDEAAWIHDELETEERLGKDVFVTQMSSEDNCVEHGVRGVIPHTALEAMWVDFDEAELPARREGAYMHLAGVIYNTFRGGLLTPPGSDLIVGHEPDRLPPYHQTCWDAGQYSLYNICDPHDRKPFAIGWYAVFPNEDVFTIAEWPDQSMRPFHKIKSWAWDVNDYAEMIRATEGLIGRPADVRLIDPNFGPAPKALSKSSVMQEFAAWGRRENYAMRFFLPPDSIADGHLAVKKLLGDPAKGVRPKLFNLRHCANHRFGYTHYGYKENLDERKGLSEKPELQHKDLMDLVRYGALYGFRFRPRPNAAQIAGAPLHVPRRSANGYVGV